MNKKKLAYIKIIIAMLIWGSLGIFIRNIPLLSSSEIVLARVVLGGIFLMIVFLAKGKRPSKGSIKKTLPFLALSGILMGFNWMFLFESYRYTTVSMATVAYYCAPIVVMIASPFMLKEKLTIYKIFGVAMAMAGLICITGNLYGGDNPVKGLGYGLMAATLYASVTLLNKKVSTIPNISISGIEITLIQLVSAGVVILPYTLITHQGAWVLPAGFGLFCLFVVGIIHTGVALYLYFSSMQVLSGQSAALCSYIDPASALIFSAIILAERMTTLQLLGAILVLGGAAFGEFYKSKKNKEMDKYEE